ncbi:MAG: hypothetical protein NTX35_20645 [Verrucomicrobia bacterium]|nr:hypothetical protein [Verrucomicrobiota bacterium]
MIKKIHQMIEDKYESLGGVGGEGSEGSSAPNAPARGAPNVSEFATQAQGGAERIDSVENANTDWIGFLFLLGNHVEQLRQNGRRPCVVLVVPTVEFASLLIATGIIFRIVMRIPNGALSESARKFDALINRAVRFPRMVRRKMRLLRGVLERFEVVNGVERLVIRYFERDGERSLRCQAYVNKEDFSLVVPDEEVVDLAARQHGRQLAADITSLQQLVGHQGAATLLGQRTNSC